MAWDINQVTLIGRLTRDPEIRYGQSGVAYSTLGLAVNRRAFKEGAEDEVHFFNIKVFGKTAELAGQYLAKGRRIGVQGHLSQNRWEDQNGQKRSTVEVVSERIQFLDSASGGGGNYQGQGQSPAPNQAVPEQVDSPPFTDEDDDIPF
ncbi:MAG TPA: single-stranded DNA-binding protein [Spirochaetes bacterium]|nr:single-stranded DNA-binding protein [Spirochaetota bacterium]